MIPDAELAPQGLQGCAKAIKAVAKHILVLKSRVEAVGGKLGIHMYPPGYLVKQYPNQPQSISFVQIWDQKNRKDFSWACGIGPNVIPLMKSFSQKNRIPFFDSFPPVMSHQRKQDLYFEKDAHWNEAGVHFVVKSLTPQLLARLREFGRPHKK